MVSSIQPILDKALNGERLTAEDCTSLLESRDIARIGVAADEIRQRKNDPAVVTYIIDRNINYTNVCNVVCTFCAFYRRPGKPDTYVHSIEEIEKRIDETIALGGTGVLMQGGLHPDFGIEWYQELLSTLHAKYPKFQLHCFSPPEIHNIHLISGLDYAGVMRRLKAAGLNSLPGGGGEILDDEVRKRVSTKCNTQEWLDVMRAVHKVGLISTATMMFGIGDRIEHRVRHLQRVRDVQDESLAAKSDDPSHGEFTAFIPWTFQRENTALGRKIKEEPTGIDYLQMLAVSRLFLDNIQHIQASWLTQGLKLGQTGLRFGADDMGSIMIEENVVSAAGASTCANEAELRYQIREAGYRPQQRDILYNYVDRDDVAELDRSDSTPLKKLSVACRQTEMQTVYLFDVDNTLLDNDRVTRDLKNFLHREVGHERADCYWRIFEELRSELGYADYLGALQRYRHEYPYESHLLTVSTYLINYPFANRLFPNSLDVIDACRQKGQVVILTDGDVVFQPRKIERSGLLEAVDGNILIYIHKEHELRDVERRYPADRYVLVDDKLRILTAVKKVWGDRVTTVFPRQGHYALDERETSKYPPADITIDRVGDLSNTNI